MQAELISPQHAERDTMRTLCDANFRRLIRANRACALFLLCATTAISSHGQTFATLHIFDGTDGASPVAALVEGRSGSLYGKTVAGSITGDGTVLKSH